MVKNKKKIIILIVVLALLALFTRTKAVHNTIILLLIFATLGEAWNLITGFAGQTSFGHAAYFGIGAYASVVLFYRYGITPLLGMILGGIIAAVIAGITSYPCFRLKGHYFAIATLAVAEVIKQLFVSWDYVEGATGISVPIISRSAGFGKGFFIYNLMKNCLGYILVCYCLE